MAHFPDFTTFSQLAKTADYVPVFRRVLSDVLTPVSAFHKIDDGGSACLFESVIGGEKVGRYSFLAAEPFLSIDAHGKHVSIKSRRRGRRRSRPTIRWKSCASGCKQSAWPRCRGLPPFTGGAVGYAGYDTVRYVEHLPNAPTDDRHLADLSFAFYDHMIVFDNVQKTAIVCVALAKGRQAICEAAYDDACRRVDRLVEKLSARRRQSAAGRH